MSIALPELDARDEDEVVADVVDALPDELTDRNRSSLAVKLVEAIGAYYAKLLFAMAQIPDQLELKLLELLGITPQAATSATVTVTLTTGGGSGAVTVPSGTLVRAGVGEEAVTFATDADVEVPGAGGTADVAATALVAGAAGNVGAASIDTLVTPVAGIASVTNAAGASGGQDVELIAQTRARAALEVRAQQRVVTAEDAEVFAAGVAGVARARAIGNTYTDGVSGLTLGAGSMTVGIVAEDLNESASSALVEAVGVELVARAFPGVNFSVFQPTVRLVWISYVQAELLPGVDEADVQAAMVDALELYLSATDVFDADGVTLLGEGWRWGEPMYRNEIISLLDRVEGVRRIVAATYYISDDYGADWGTPFALSADVAAGAGSADLVGNFGLLHLGTEYSPPGALTLDVV
jgi:hypothetical protein